MILGPSATSVSQACLKIDNCTLVHVKKLLNEYTECLRSDDTELSGQQMSNVRQDLFWWGLFLWFVLFQHKNLLFFSSYWEWNQNLWTNRQLKTSSEELLLKHNDGKGQGRLDGWIGVGLVDAQYKKNKWLKTSTGAKWVMCSLRLHCYELCGFFLFLFF